MTTGADSVAAALLGPVAATTRESADIAVLRKALDASQSAAAQVLEAMPDVRSFVGTIVDVYA